MLDKNVIHKPEILSPAGDNEKLRVAVRYGADAVYLAGEDFGLRKASKNFSLDEISKAVLWTHSRGCKLYVTVNIFPREDDFGKLSEFLAFLDSVNVDGVIVADPGIFDLAAANAPNVPIHISTQANVTNSHAALFWQRLGASRIVLARECTLENIRSIRDSVSLELEMFVHGAMCVAYSGRCLLSSVMTGRDANRGNCSHPCRWKYFLSEEKRPGQLFPVLEDNRGVYVFNSKDICLLRHIGTLAGIGIDSFKIEGRIKGQYYVAAVTKAYRTAVDALANGEYTKELEMLLAEELYTVNKRGYCNGFLFGQPEIDAFALSANNEEKYSIVGSVGKPVGDNFWLNVKSRFFINDSLTILSSRHNNMKNYRHTGKVSLIEGLKGDVLSVAQPNQEVLLHVEGYTPYDGDIIRKERDGG